MANWNNIIDIVAPTFTDWNNCIEEAGLHLKWSEQLGQIHDTTTDKIIQLKESLLQEQASSALEIIDGVVVSRETEKAAHILDIQRKIQRSKVVVLLCIKESEIREVLNIRGVLPITPEKYKNAGNKLVVDKTNSIGVPNNFTRNPIGTTYYIDADSGLDSNDGLTTGTAWKTLAQYTTTTVRAAGDIAILRRDTTNPYSTTDTVLNFDEDGTILSQITVEADYNNSFGGDVDISLTATATTTFGSKTWTFSSDVSGVISVGDVLYIVGDDNKLYSYEVKTIATTVVTMYFPYKGTNAGSGKTVTNMGTNPIWGLSTFTAGYIFLNNTNYWKIQGLEFISDQTTQSFKTITARGLTILDCVGKSNTALFSNAISLRTTYTSLLQKYRSQNAFSGLNVDNCGDVLVKDIHLQGRAGTSETLRSFSSPESVVYEDVEIIDGQYNISTSISSADFRNCTMTGATSGIIRVQNPRRGKEIRFEDFQGVLGDTRVYTDKGTSSIFTSGPPTLILQSDTSIIRSGGAAITTKVLPHVNLSDNPAGKIKVFDIPIYADTTSKTYTFYFKSTTTTDWTANPTATQLWIELEAWGHATNNVRKITKSTDTVNFTGLTTWQPITVTVAPSQTGVAYLRVWYSKPKESTKTNIFYADPFFTVA